MRWWPVAVLVAQAAGSVASAQPPPRAAEPPVTPPRVVSVPEVELPADVEAPEDGAVEIVLLVAVDGTATVVECSAVEALCAPVREAIARAVFEPARRGATPVPARIGMRFAVRVAEPEPEPDRATRERAGGGAGERERAPREAPAPIVDDEGFAAVAQVERPPAGALRLELEETRELPGAFGDPFRALDAMPGVTPILSGLPYFLVRGAPPAGSLYVYDGITLPALYHLGLGPAVVHPRMIGPLRLYTGVPPARFGRFIGGVIEAEGPPPAAGGTHGEVELRLLDVTGMVQAPVGGGEIAVAGRYGYPGLLLSIFSPEVSLAYWDYQIRFAYPIGGDDRLEVVSLGSYDSLTTVNEVDRGAPPEERESSLRLQFHRVETRLVRQRRDFELGAALRLGWEQSGLDDEVGIAALTLGPRLWLRLALPDVTLRAGAEMFGAAGDMRFTPDDGDGAGTGSSPQDPARNPVFASAAARNTAGLYGEVSWRALDALTLDLGLRTDVWATGSTVEAALDPRLRATYHLSDSVDLHLAGGVARQPAVFFVPLPGLTEVAIDRGLQTAAQGEAGVAARLGEELEVEAQLFVHRYWSLLFPDLFLEDDVCTEIGAGCREIQPDPRVEGLSYGGELFVRRPIAHRLSGFLSYTLAWAELDAIPGIDYTPSYDIRHVVNLAGRWDIGSGFSAGVRLHFRSGKPLGVWYLSVEDFALGRYEQRLPPFFRADAQVAYQWRTSWGRMRLALEWLNLTFSREPTDLDCQDGLTAAPSEPCPVEYIPAIVVPNLGLRGTF